MLNFLNNWAVCLSVSVYYLLFEVYMIWFSGSNFLVRVSHAQRTWSLPKFCWYVLIYICHDLSRQILRISTQSLVEASKWFTWTCNVSWLMNRNSPCHAIVCTGYKGFWNTCSYNSWCDTDCRRKRMPKQFAAWTQVILLSIPFFFFLVITFHFFRIVLCAIVMCALSMVYIIIYIVFYQ